MMRAIGLSFLVSACAAAPSAPPACVTDEQCSAGLVCFPDGCGDPTRGLAVEVTGGSTTGLFPQDFVVDQLGPTQDFQIKGPLTLVGSFQREKTSAVDPTQRDIYTAEVVVRAAGESAIIPGVSRTFQSRYAMTDRGTFSMNVGQGQFSVVAQPLDFEIPPLTIKNVVAGPDGGTVLNFAFPSVAGSVTIAGRLVKRRGIDGNPDQFITQAPIDLQAFDPTTNEPLSQRVATSSGHAGARGEFIVVMAPKARALSTIELVATPRDTNPADPSALLPSRRFQLSPPFPATVTLELGDFGEGLPAVPGTVVGVDGAPLAEAIVVLEGRAKGGATFRSKAVTTDVSGRFTLDLLPADRNYTLTVYPKPGGRSGATSVLVEIKNQDEPGVEKWLEPRMIRCVERVPVTGSVLLPDGMPAAGLTIHAQEVGPSARSLPLDDVTVRTSLEGDYELRLDPGEWRLEFQPAGDLPYTSRLLTVSTAGVSPGSTTAQPLPTITLPRGRRLTGTVTSTVSTRGPTPLVNAQVRFFRVTRIDGKPASVLLGAGVTNGVGSYTVILPTRDQPKQ